MSALTESISLDRLDEDPYPVYAQLRSEEPVVWVPAVKAIFLTRWQDVRQAMSCPGSFTTTNTASPLATYCGPENILNQEGDRHAKTRESVDDLFSTESAPSVAAHARSLAAERLRALADRPQVDLMTEYFEPVGTAVSGWFLGLGEIDTPTLVRWSASLTAALYNPTQDPEAQRLGMAVSGDMDQALGPLLEQLAASPDDSVLSRLLHAGRSAGPVREASEVLATVKMMMSAVREPGWLAGNTLHALLTHPDQLAAVRADSALLGAAVHEGLRWCPPVGGVGRVAAKDVVLGGTEIPIGTALIPCIASANRDETVFSEADRFDVLRPRTPYMSLGYGRHQCLAAHLVPAIVEAMLEQLLAYRQELRLDDEVRPYGWKFRKFETLPVSWQGRA